MNNEVTASPEIKASCDILTNAIDMFLVNLQFGNIDFSKYGNDGLLSSIKED